MHMIVKKLTICADNKLIVMRDGVSFLRNHYGIKNSDIAKKCHVTGSMISMLLRGKSHSKRCLRIIEEEISKYRLKAS
jgi:hypothetical protein